MSPYGDSLSWTAAPATQDLTGKRAPRFRVSLPPVTGVTLTY